ncbi:MAG: YkgJ family cysteine cluster protein [Thiotrichaceae bacterium]|nr:YkgJ family cysteine cluster protein [Thiotrichaceae bacterium]
MRHKIERVFTSILPVDKNRQGNCNNCGACCRLPNRCVFLKASEDGKEYCSIYTIRPPSCRKFPRTIEQYQHVKEVCGYDFNEDQ